MIDTEALRKKIIELAIQGKLTQQLPEDGNAEELYAQIQEEKAKLIKEGKIKKEKSLSEISDDEVPFEIPENWKWVRVADIAFLSSGKPYKETEEGQLYIKVSDMNLPENETQIITSTHFVDVKNDGIIPVNSIIFPKRGGAIATNKKRMIIQNPVFVDLNTMGMTVILADIFMYIKYWFDTLKLDEIQNGTTIPQVNNKDIYPLILPLPPVEEQKRIVEILDGVVSQIDIIDEYQQQYEYDCEILKEKIIDAGIRGKLTEQLLEDGDAEELYAQIQEEKARLIKEGKIKKEKPLPEITDDEIPFEIPSNWKWVRLGNYSQKVTDQVASGSFASLRDNVPSLKEPSYAIMVKTADFANNFSKNLTYTDKNGYEFLSNSNLFGGELILSNIGSIGKCFIVPKLNSKMTLAPNSVMIRLTNDELRDYLYYFILSKQGYMELDGISTGIAVKKFNKTDLKRILIPVPPFDEQKRITSRIEELLTLLRI